MLFRSLAADVDLLTSLNLAANTRATIDLSTSTQLPVGTSAIAATVRSTGTAAGSLTLAPCTSIGNPALTNNPSMAFEAGVSRVLHTIVPLSAGRTFCARATAAVALQFSLEGTLVGGLGAPADALSLNSAATSSIVPATVGTSDATPTAVGATGDGASVQVSTTSGTGTVQVYVGACGEERPALPSVIVRKGEAGVGLTYTATGSGNVCIWRTSTASGLPAVNVAVTGT